MGKGNRFVGLDVHKETIAVAVAEQDGEVRFLGTISNDEQAIGKLVRELRSKGKNLSFCYEAGPTGYALYWQLTKLGVSCVVIAPSLVPVKAGDRVKTDRRDAEKLARCFRAQDLTPVWVPTKEHEALRDLVRAREGAKKDQRRARNRLQKFLLRQGIRKPKSMREWTETHRKWVVSLPFEIAAQEATRTDCMNEIDHQNARIERLDACLDEAILAAPETMRKVIEALQTMRGISKLTAATIVSEVGKLERFEKPTELMAYAGMVPSEHSSGQKTSRGQITKTGNAHLRRVIGEAAWHYRHRPKVIGNLRKRQQGAPPQAIDIAWKAQERLHKRFRVLSVKKCKQKVVTAVGRELLGFVWAIGVEIERAAAKETRKTKAA